MTPFIIIFIIFIIRLSWNEYRKNKIYQQKPTPGNWIEAWLDSKSFNYFTGRNVNERNYILDVSLKTCSVNIMIWENLHEPNLIVEVAYPVFVPKDKGNSIRHLVKKLNGQLEACQLMLERQSGRLYFKYHNKSKIAGISKRQEVIADVDRLLHIADDSFPEIMSVLYGSSFPEMASLKIFGFPDSALN